MAEFVGALDQGTTSSRFMVFDHQGREVARHQLEHAQVLPRPGWVEHDPLEVLARSLEVMAGALQRAGLRLGDLAAVGVANQRETTVVWDPTSGRPYLNAIVWQDTRTSQVVSELEASGQAGVVRELTGLPPATYFSAPKLTWALRHVPGLGDAARQGRALFGTVDSWLIWNLTGGPRGGRHVTDITNASRTMLMDLATGAWDERLLNIFGVPPEMLPAVQPSSGLFGEILATGRPDGVELPGGAGGAGRAALTADLGDQQAAMVGQVCFERGDAKNTYGTGNFLLLNTGTAIERSGHGLLSTACYQWEGQKPFYALEGSIAVTGSAVQWLRDQLGLIADAAETEALAGQVEDSGGVYFVPAFSGLFAPYWRPQARGTIVGLTRASTKAHLARATLEAICFQTRDVLEAMCLDTGGTLDCLKVDGGVTANHLCMQVQADVLGIPVSKPVVAETTALGAAYAAGLAAGFWSGPAEIRANWQEERRWEPSWDEARREEAYDRWKKAVRTALSWEEA